MSEFTRRRALKALAALGAGGAVAPILSACNGGSQQPVVADLPAVKIGLVVPRSGVFKTVGDELFNGFQLYLDLNDRRLAGHPVNLVIVDEGETAESGKAAVERLIKQENVLALSGVASSASMVAVRELVENSQIPLIGSNASPTTLRGVRYIWRTSYVNDEPATALGRFVASKVGNGPVALIAPDYQAGHDELNGFLSAYGKEVAGEPIYTPFSPTPTTNFQPYLNTIKASRAKAVLCFYAGSLAVEFVKQYRQLGLTQDLYAPGFLTEGVLLRQQGDAARGIYTSMNYSSDLDNDANRRFASAYQKAYNNVPTAYAMASYDAAFVLDKAISVVGSGDLNPQAVNLALGKIGSIDSPRGSWQFNQNRTPLQMWYLRQVRQDGGTLANTVLSPLTTLG
ncbi:ABC transporter substrate-binding protein [Planosporangium flavigriseum]|uniref:ABC transporter substrate-binding protein n=1 Tax=Planosporangium flavigriseum TaxID=373681 RepID=A0A8J3LIG3_9ACTN|nr:ABC transporter substrate-binding protein [Planosporangium flavigriseum]NJC64608.1 ABC transporter substrate-binding protein [Planosporangium flavigriseum]GIG71909.1 ABC transporter substrate-binding protein [Planosporangium flavigriseum]